MCDYKKPKPVKIVVESTPPGRGNGKPCHCLKEGDEFIFDFERCPQNFCASAFHSLWPSLRVLELGGHHPWDTQEGITRVVCPDPERPVILRLEVVGEKSGG
jgi:uncharacterized repeat protein (TIGR04076 family)